MSYLEDTYINVYEEIRATEPYKSQSIKSILSSIANPSPKDLKLLNSARKCAEVGDLEGKKQFKKGLTNYTFSSNISQGRKKENITSFTGLIALDFDGLQSKNRAEELKQFLIKTNYILATWLSPSALGVRALIRIPIVEDVKEFKSYFNAISNYFTELKLGSIFDNAPNNPVLVLYTSLDKKVLTNKYAITWTDKKEIEQNKKDTVIENKAVSGGYLARHRYNRVEKYMSTWIKGIIAPGHTELLKASYTLGGLVGSNWLNQGQAEEIAITSISNNPYLSRSGKEINNYIKTAKQTIVEGMKKPCNLPNLNTI